MKPVSMDITPVGNDKYHVAVEFDAKDVSNVFMMANRMLAYTCSIDSTSDQDLPGLIAEKMTVEGLEETYMEAIPSMLMPFVIGCLDFETILAPTIVETEKPLKSAPFHFTLEVTKKPDYELSDYGPVVVKVPKTSLAEDEVEGFLATIADEAADFVPADEGHRIEYGDRILMDIETNREFGPVPLLTRKDVEVNVGEGWLIETFDENVLGLKAGDKKRFKFQALSEVSKDENDTETLSSTVTIKAIWTRVEIELTDEWVAANIPDCNTIDELREMVKKNMFESGDNTPEDEKTLLAAVAAGLASRLQGKITDEMYEHYLNDRLAQMSQQAVNQNLDFDAYLETIGLTFDTLGEFLMDQATTQLTQGLALDAYFRHYGLEINSHDVDVALGNMLGTEHENIIKGNREQFELAGRLYILEEAARRLKANKVALSRARFESED